MWETKALWLVRATPDFIARVHEADLTTKVNRTSVVMMWHINQGLVWSLNLTTKVNRTSVVMMWHINQGLVWSLNPH